MNKKQFIEYMKSQMEGMTYEQKMKLLRKIETDYLPSVINECKKKEGYWVPPDKEKEYFHCPKCKKYTLKEKCKEEFKTEVRVETTYVDAGYGDDDMMGEVEYFVQYTICPYCYHKKEIHKFYMRKIREWNRREGRK